MKYYLLIFTLFITLTSSAQYSEIELIKSSISSNYKHFKAIDFDVDGLTDIITSSSGSITFHKNMGNNIFEVKSLGGGGHGDYFMEIADMDNDGHYDIITDSYDAISILINDGQNNFSETLITDGAQATNRDFTKIKIEDVDSDGFLDIIAIRESGATQVKWYRNVNLLFFPNLITGAFNSPTIYDFDNDGNQDILDYDSNGIKKISYSNGSFTSSYLVSNTIQVNPTKYTIQVIDINGDQNNDLLLYDINEDFLYTYDNAINGYNQSSFPLSFGNDTKYFFGDFNNDGFTDVLQKWWSNTYLKINNQNTNSPYGPSLPGTEIAEELDFFDFQFADLNGDGNNDFILLENDSVTYLSQELVGTYKPFYVYKAKSGNGFDIVDINNDNKKDIVLNSTGFTGITLFQNFNGLSFSKIVIDGKTISNLNTHLIAEDINNDNNIDLLTNNDLYLMSTTSVLEEIDFPNVESPIFVDFNGDGFLDIIGYHFSKIKVYYNDGTGQNFAEQILVNQNLPEITDIRALDFDSDNDIDIITHNDNNAVRLYENLGNGNFSNNVIGNLNRGFDLGDINNDGNMDLIGADFNSLYLIVNDGSNNFPSSTSISTQKFYPTFKDIDNDSDLDIISYNVATNKTAILYNNSGNFTSTDIGQIDINYGSIYLPKEMSYKVDYIDNDNILDIAFSNEYHLIVYSSENYSLSVNNYNTQSKSTFIYPNPADNFINIKSINNDIFIAYIIDINGRLLKSINNPTKIDVSFLDSGMYILKLKGMSKSQSFKFFKK